MGGGIVTRPNERLLGDRQPPESSIQQVLHGYDHGHRQLAGSYELDDVDRRLVDRLSDASGQRPVADNDGYLTGYPLPSGQFYALARTWYVPHPPRPNVVWTHTLLIPPAALAGRDLGGLLDLLRRPRPGEENGWANYYLPLAGPRQRPTGSAPVAQIDRSNASMVLDALYRTGSDSAVCVVPGLEMREALCIAVWNQQWPRMRRHFSFCAGALESRSTGTGPFDLLLMPPSHSFRPSNSSNSSLPGPVLHALEDDLLDPGALRVFLRKCGPDSSRRRVMPIFVEAFTDAIANRRPIDIVRRVTSQAPRAASMRRLKRALLEPDHGLLCDFPAADVLWAIAADDVSEHVLLDDSSLGTWAIRTWHDDADPVLVLIDRWRRASSREEHMNFVVDDANQGSVRAAGQESLERVVVDAAEPRHLELIVEYDPALAATVLSQRSGTDWWGAWARLPAAAFEPLLATGHLDGSPRLTEAVRALLSVPSGPFRWRAVRDQVGVRAVVELLSHPGFDEAFSGVLSERPELVFAALAAGLSASQIAVAWDALGRLEVFRAAGFARLLPLAQAEALWREEPRRAVLLFVSALDSEANIANHVVARAYACIYDAFARNEAWDVWWLLSRALSERREDWDRCRWLARAAADVGAERRDMILAAVPLGGARDALADEVTRLVRKRK